MFQDAIADVDARRKTLTLFNAADDDDLHERIVRYFSFRNVDVETATTDPATPTSYALLHDGDDVLALSRLTELRAFLSETTRQVGFETLDDVESPPDVVSPLSETLYTVSGGTPSLLRRRARDIETLARQTGGGALHACLQEPRGDPSDDAANASNASAGFDGFRAAERIRGLIDTGVDVHLYGPSSAVPECGAVRHAEPCDDLTDGWAVVYDGGGRRTRMAALVVESRPEGYHGFWTLQPDIVEELCQSLAVSSA